MTPFILKQCEIDLVGHDDRDFVRYLCDGIRDGFNPFTSDFTVTVSDINGLYFFIFFSIKFIVIQEFE